MYITPNHIKELKENEVFVFGSNRQGRHEIAPLFKSATKLKNVYLPEKFVNNLQTGFTI
jgi:hypothetical protein